MLQDKYDEQLAFFSDHIKQYSNDVSGYRGRASALWYMERLDEAVADLDRALELNPVDLLSLSCRGQVEAERGNSAEALRDLDIALRILDSAPRTDPVRAEYYRSIEAFVRRGRGVAFMRKSEFSTAMAEFEKSLSLFEGNAWTYYSRAQTYEQMGNASKALSDYRKSLEKSGPPLSRIRKEIAMTRVRALSG